MKRPSRRSLTPELRRALEEPEPQGPAFLLITVEPDGAPRTALLAPEAVATLSTRRLAFPLSPASRSLANLLARPAALFVPARGLLATIRGRGRVLPPLRSLPGAVGVSFDIEEVLFDAPLPEETRAGARSGTGLGFSAPAPLRRLWRAAAAELAGRRGGTDGGKEAVSDRRHRAPEARAAPHGERRRHRGVPRRP